MIAGTGGNRIPIPDPGILKNFHALEPDFDYSSRTIQHIFLVIPGIKLCAPVSTFFPSQSWHLTFGYYHHHAQIICFIQSYIQNVGKTSFSSSISKIIPWCTTIVVHKHHSKLSTTKKIITETKVAELPIKPILMDFL